MEFPTEAIYDPAAAALTPSWDGRDDADQFDREIQHTDDGILDYIASRDEQDEAGSTSTSVKAVATNKMKLNSKEAICLAPAVMMMNSHNSGDDEPVSPHVHVENADPKQYNRVLRNQEHRHRQYDLVVTSNDVQTPISPASPVSPYSINNINSNNSLLLNLSDLEHTLNDETSTLKNLMIKLKSERDQLRQTKASLTKQLAHQQTLVEEQEKRHENEVSSLKVELSKVKSEWENEVQSLRKNLEEVQLHHKHQYNQMLEQNKTALDLLVLESSVERENIMSQLKESQNQVQHLQNEIDEAQAKLTQLTEEIANRQKMIKSLLDEKRCFQLHEEESKMEIKRLQKSLEEQTGDILRCFESKDDNSEASSDGDDEMAPSIADNNIVVNQGGVLLTIPNLCDMDVTETSMIPATTTSFEECDLVTEQFQQLQDDHMSNVDTLKLKARMETHTVVNEEYYQTKVNEELKKLQFKLDVQVRVNELLSNELVMLHRGKSSEGNISPYDQVTADLKSDSALTQNAMVSMEKIVEQLQEQLKNQVERNEMLSSELATVRSKVTNDAAVQVGKDVDEAKREHQIEIKLLKNELAEAKTMVKLLSREYDSLTDAYAVEQKSNDELEKSLEEVVHLLMTQRAVQDNNAKETKMLKTKAK